jgi:hypothetical protein
MGLLVAVVLLSMLVTEASYAQQTPWEESSEILSDAVEDLRESGEFNEEADLNAEAIDQGTAPEEEEEEEEEQRSSSNCLLCYVIIQTAGSALVMLDLFVVAVVVLLLLLLLLPQAVVLLLLLLHWCQQ